MSSVEIINTIEEEEFREKAENLIEKGFTMETADIGTNEVGEPFYRAILVKEGGET